MKKMWSKEKITDELNNVIQKLGYFPSTVYLRTYYKSLYHAISNGRYGGRINYFRTALGYKTHHLQKYWSEKNTLIEIQKVMLKIGHFPTIREIKYFYGNDLVNSIRCNGGIYNFAKKMKITLNRKQYNYWNDETIQKELNNIIVNIKHFPTVRELRNIDCGLYNAISKTDSIYKYREVFGFPITSLCEYRTYLAMYIAKRGKKTENLVFDILSKYCLCKELNLPHVNIKLSKGNIIEFVCENDKKIGIDVTNTERKEVVSKKYFKKDYYKYLTELWIVVVSDSFTKEDYIKWNNESPNNVYIYSIDELIEELQLDLDEYTKNKIETYKKCTFHTKDSFKEQSLNTRKII